MKTRKFSPLFVSLLGAGMILLLILGAPNLFAQDKTAVGGKLTCNFVDQKQFAVDNIQGQPQTTFKGNFTYIAGTGQYKNIEGSGQYTGAFTSPTSYTVEWEGKYS